MTEAQTLLTSIREKQAERDRLLATLDLWASVQAQGIAVDTVDTFGYEPTWIDPKLRYAIQRARMGGKPDPITGKRYPPFGPRLYPGERLPNGHYTCEVYNYVRLKSGEKVRLDPVLKAV
jgi:hypothetical protein